MLCIIEKKQQNMICPHCSTAVKYSWNTTHPFNENNGKGSEIAYAICPNCDKVVIYLQHGILGENSYSGAFVEGVEWKKLLYPKTENYLDSNDIPKEYQEDYEEAIKVLSASPKASAALSRRLLQSLLREEYQIEERNLSLEIEAFINKEGIPSHLTDAVDAVRNIGNFAAHPIKNKNTGEIVPVESGEAEWLIEVIEALFDFTFIQPIKLNRRREELNVKLKQIGKPELKKK